MILLRTKATLDECEVHLNSSGSSGTAIESFLAQHILSIRVSISFSLALLKPYFILCKHEALLFGCLVTLDIRDRSIVPTICHNKVPSLKSSSLSLSNDISSLSSIPIFI